VRLNFGLPDVLDLDPARISRLPSGAANVPGFFMSEKLRNAILTDSGMRGVLPLDSRRPIIHAAESYAKSLINLVDTLSIAKKRLPLHCAS